MNYIFASHLLHLSIMIYQWEMGLGELVAFLQYWIQMNSVLLHVEKPFIEVMPRKVEWEKKLVSMCLYTLVRLSEWSSVVLVTSVQFSRSVVSDSLWPHEPQHARPPCPSPTPGVHPNPCLLSRWCHPTISFSVIPFSHLQSFPAWGSFQVSQLFTSGGQSIGVSASTPVLPMNIQDWFPLGWTGWISLQSKGLSRVFSNTRVQKHQFFGAQIYS